MAADVSEMAVHIYQAVWVTFEDRDLNSKLSHTKFCDIKKQG